MAASLEHQLVSKILELQDFHTVEKQRLTEDFFFQPEYREIFSYIKKHFHDPATFNCVPSAQLVQQVFTGFHVVQSQDPLPTLCNQIRLAKMRVEIQELADALSERAQYNPQEALSILKEASANLSSRHEYSNDLLLSNAYDILLEEYERVVNSHGVTGLPWPWPPLNEATQGIHPGEFVLIYGRPKNMKTWLALYVMTIVNMYANSRVLIYSLEMNPKQITRRVASIRALVNYGKLMAGQLQPEDRDRFFYRLWELKAMSQNPDPHLPRNPDLLVVSGKGGGGISFLHSKIREFRPDIVLVDGVYLMTDDRQNKKTIDWKAIAHISQDIKRTATDFEIPIIGTAQANRKADNNAKNADLREVAYSDALAQDTDFSIRVQKRIDKSTGNPELVLAFPGSRETDIDSILVNGIPATDFSLKSTHVATTGDEEDDDAQKPKRIKNGHNTNSQHTAVPALPHFSNGVSDGKVI